MTALSSSFTPLKYKKSFCKDCMERVSRAQGVCAQDTYVTQELNKSKKQTSEW